MDTPSRSLVIQTGAGSGDDGFQLSASSFGGAVQDYKLYFARNVSTEWLVDLYKAVTRDVYKLLNDVRKREGELFKWYLTLEVTFRQMKNPNIVTDPPVYFKSQPVLFYMGDTSETLQRKMKVLVEKIENYEKNWIRMDFQRFCQSHCRTRKGR